MTSEVAQFVPVNAACERDNAPVRRSATDTAFSAALARLEAFGRFSIRLIEFPLESGRRPPQELNGALGRLREFLETLS